MTTIATILQPIVPPPSHDPSRSATTPLPLTAKLLLTDLMPNLPSRSPMKPVNAPDDESTDPTTARFIAYCGLWLFVSACFLFNMVVVKKCGKRANLGFEKQKSDPAFVRGKNETVWFNNGFFSFSFMKIRSRSEGEETLCFSGVDCWLDVILFLFLFFYFYFILLSHLSSYDC